MITCWNGRRCSVNTERKGSWMSRWLRQSSMAAPSVRKLHSVEAIGTRPAAAEPLWRSARPPRYLRSAPRARRGSLALRAVGSTSRRFPLEAGRSTTRHSLHGLELVIKRHELLSLEDCLTSLDALEVILELMSSRNQILGQLLRPRIDARGAPSRLCRGIRHSR